MTQKKRKRRVPISLWVSEAEYDTIRQRMAEAGTQNVSTFIRKMALNGYVLHVDLSPVGELVRLQRRCAGNMNQIAIHANTAGIYPHEIAALQKDYALLWGRVAAVLKELASVTAL